MLSRIPIIAVISPLLVGIVLQTDGWTLLLSRPGLVNQALHVLRLIDSSLHLMGGSAAES